MPLIAPHARWPRGLPRLAAAQFTSGLADNALLIVAIALLQDRGDPPWWIPLLKLMFTLAYVLLAPWAGALADRWPKARVMGAANALKGLSCVAAALGVPVLACYGVAGVGAAVYSPAKYGLATELVPARRLVEANGWIEVSTVLSILLGTVLGGVLCSASVVELYGSAGLPAALWVLVTVYGLAAGLNAGLPDSGAARVDLPGPVQACRAFAADNRRLWRDALGQVSLATTTLFWGIGGSLQLLTIDWAQSRLDFSLSEASGLQGISAFGVVAGAAMAGRWIALEQAPKVLALGVVLGGLMVLMNAVHTPAHAMAVLVLAGMLAGLFVVPMNALLQHRGCTLVSAGRSIAVQNFNENLGVLAMLSLHTLASRQGLDATTLMTALGSLTAVAMAAIAWRHRSLQRRTGPPARSLLSPTAACKDLP